MFTAFTCQNIPSTVQSSFYRPAPEAPSHPFFLYLCLAHLNRQPFPFVKQQNPSTTRGSLRLLLLVNLYTSKVVLCSETQQQQSEIKILLYLKCSFGHTRRTAAPGQLLSVNTCADADALVQLAARLQLSLIKV